MNTSTTEENGTTQVTTVEQPKPNKKASVAAQRAHFATKKAKSAHKATSASKASKATKAKPGRRAAKQPSKGRQKPAPARGGTKTAKVLDLLKRASGATLKELMADASYCTHLAGCERFSIGPASFR
jgi:hypothetical protein